MQKEHTEQEIVLFTRTHFASQLLTREQLIGLNMIEEKYYQTIVKEQFVSYGLDLVNDTIYKIRDSDNLIVLQYGTYKLSDKEELSINPHNISWKIRRN